MDPTDSTVPFDKQKLFKCIFWGMFVKTSHRYVKIHTYLAMVETFHCL